jgi:hypothetical protein
MLTYGALLCAETRQRCEKFVIPMIYLLCKRLLPSLVRAALFFTLSSHFFMIFEGKVIFTVDPHGSA